jgi:predicted nucleic acid-binding Zn ribbon protein
MPTTPAPGAASAPIEPLHGCVRCGARIPIAESMCERCNPLGLKAPAASQAHGIAFVGIAIAVVLMAVAARLAISGVGPFPSSLTGVAADPAGLRVTVSVTNRGGSAGATTCRITDPDLAGIGPETAFVQSPILQPGVTTTFDTIVTSLGSTPRTLSVDCDR